jgi:TetR/AcrR family transcriptional regulator
VNHKKAATEARGNARERILETALREFAGGGFSGARMDRIAAKAEINKAMLYYYFASKKNLYKNVLQGVLQKLLPQIQPFLGPEASPAEILEKLPDTYIRFFSRYQNFLKIIAIDLVQNPAVTTSIIREILASGEASVAGQLKKRIRQWHEEGRISEPDPIHFMLNVVSLSLFFFIGKPMIETLFDRKIPEDEKFYATRIQSVSNVLKRGMLK